MNPIDNFAFLAAFLYLRHKYTSGKMLNKYIVLHEGDKVGSKRA